MIGLEIGPEGIDDIKVGIDGLGWQEAAEASPSTPPDHKVDPGDPLGGKALWQAGLIRALKRDEMPQIPEPTVIDQEVHLDGALPEDAPPLGVGEELLWEEGGVGVAHNKEGGVPASNALDSVDAGLLKGLALDRWALGVVLGKAVESQFLDS